MKIKKSFPLKLLAFLLAVICLAGCAVLACYQIMEIDLLWRNTDATSSRQIHRLMKDERYDIILMLELRADTDRTALEDAMLEELEARFDPANTNLRWQIRSRDDDTLLYSNIDGELTADAYAGYWHWFTTDLNRDVCIYMWLDRELPAADHYLPLVNHARFLQINRIPLLAVTASLALVWFILTICLCAWSGWRKGHDEVSLCWFHRIPGDLLLAAYILAGALLAVPVVNSAYYIWEQLAYPLWAQLTIAGLVGGAAALLLTSFLITLCARCKGRVLLRNMIVVRIIVGFVTVVAAAVRSIPLIWKVALGGAVYLALSFLFILVGYRAPFWFVVWVVLTLGCLVYLGGWAYHWKKIRQATEEIIDGIIDCHIDTDFMPRDLREHANELNHLNEAIGEAVDERLRSEHFKAELITNVSHDLKTPLTSIINYADLIEKEPVGSEKIPEYASVLHRQSERLKRLVDDLVEASRASTGDMEMQLAPCELGVLLTQAAGEYEERLKQSRLQLILRKPENEVRIMADGRRLWRVFDNLMGNICKYAQPDTRVYLTLEEGRGKAEISFKNTSREPLELGADELMERFVRGDQSRHSEGNGLGLSIARSLTELQNGTLELTVDGDLFKVVLIFPVME